MFSVFRCVVVAIHWVDIHWVAIHWAVIYWVALHWIVIYWVALHCRGGLNPPVYTKRTVIGQIQSAPTVGVHLGWRSLCLAFPVGADPCVRPYTNSFAISYRADTWVCPYVDISSTTGQDTSFVLLSLLRHGCE
jgi:hypothetical protein